MPTMPSIKKVLEIQTLIPNPAMMTMTPSGRAIPAVPGNEYFGKLLSLTVNQIVLGTWKIY
jgi:hypothetical protein